MKSWQIEITADRLTQTVCIFKLLVAESEQEAIGEVIEIIIQSGLINPRNTIARESSNEETIF